MFVIPGIAALLLFVYVRPHEIFETLRPVTLGHVLMAVILGYLLDLRVGVARIRASPLRSLALAFFAWTLVSIAVKAPSTIGIQLPLRAAALIAFLAISEGLQSLRALGVAASIVLVVSLFLATVGVQQANTSPICVNRDDKMNGDLGSTAAEARPCQTPMDCVEGGRMGVEYACEHPGAMGTRSIGGRVRYRGRLQDPNELAWAIGVALPFAFAWYESKRSIGRIVGVLAAAAVTVACVIFTQSRSGQLALPAAVGVLFFRRFGWRGTIIAAILSSPILLLGGRSGEGAESSSIERLECWATALDMWRENPFMGVGTGQFLEHHFLTAHNSFLLTLAELGPLGLFLWTMVLYVAFKISLCIQIDFAKRPEAAAARRLALAMTGMLSGFVVSGFFLSLPYHEILWFEIGLVGALYTSVRSHAPEWKVRITRRDLLFVAGFDISLVVAIALYIRMKGV